MLANCFGRSFVTGGNSLQGKKCLRGLTVLKIIVSGGYCPRWLFVWGAYGPVAIVRELLDGAFDLEIPEHKLQKFYIK